ncbi:MAG TPA: hypothetical protein VHI54_08740 [Actinomycetota bacterium]|nr:hypothetical protein [Actinomycetota bacterium]
MARSGDSRADSFGFLPDHVPDDLVARYGKNAQRSVRYSKSTRYRLGQAVARTTGSLKNEDVLSTAAVIMTWAVAVVALVAGMAYVFVLWPEAALALTGTLLILGGLSLALALQISRKRKEGEEPVL